MFVNVISLLGATAIFCEQANSMQQMGKMGKNGYSHFGMDRQYATNYESSSAKDKVLVECEKLSKKMALSIAKNNLTTPQAYDIKLKLHEGVFHAVRPENFEYINIYKNIERQFIIFNDLIKILNQGKTCGEHRSRYLDENIHHNYYEFHDLMSILNRDNKCVDHELVKNMEKMCSDSFILLGWINDHSNTHTNKSNIE